MTLIAGIRTPEGAFIGGDSGSFDEDGNAVIAFETKVWRMSDTLLGVAGSFRVAEIAQRSNIADPYQLRDYLIGEFSLNSSNGAFENFEILILSLKGIYYIYSDFSVVRVRETYGAVGSGTMVALGALFVNSHTELTSTEVIRLALKAGNAHTSTVRPPYKLLKITYSG